MLNKVLKDYHLILASGSPRRQQFLRELHLEFEVCLKPIDEVYPAHLEGSDISDYLAKAKAVPFLNDLKKNEILITADTVVWHNQKSLAKAKNAEEAMTMLKLLSSDWHDVITSVCFTTTDTQIMVNQTTHARFKTLSEQEIRFYIENFRPYDKAGAYGIQEWIGLIGIEEIRGSYPNVVGLPTHLVYKTLASIAR